MARKLDVLRSEREAIQEEVEANELLGRSVTSRVACVATPAETSKVFLHVAEVDKITALLLALAGRLARAQNALLSLPDQAEAQEKVHHLVLSLYTVFQWHFFSSLDSQENRLN